MDFEYDHNGLRTQKKVVENGITTIYDYTLHGKLITHLTKRVVNEEGIETSKEEFHFFYDAQSKPVIMKYSGNMYHYVHNLKGDIVAILDASGNSVVEYKYDVWGNVVSVFAVASELDEVNPFRYRCYTWDKDAELYYLKSRYYDTRYGRFISPDTVAEKYTPTLAAEKNLYAYCYNDANDYVDEDGAAGFLATLIGGAIVGGIVNVATTIISHVAKPNKDKDDELTFRDIAFSFASGAVSGAFSIIPGFSGRLLGSAMSAMVESAGYYFECVEEGKAYEWQEVAMRYSYNFATGMLNPVIKTEYGTKILKGTVGEVVSYGYDQLTSDIGRYYEDLRGANTPPAAKTEGWFKWVYDPLMGKYRYVRVHY